MHPLASVEPLTGILSALSGEIFRQDGNEIFTVDDALCDRIPLIASIVNFAFCIGAYYSDSYNERLAMRLYDNGKRLFLQSNSSSLVSPVKTMVIFIWVNHVHGD